MSASRLAISKKLATGIYRTPQGLRAFVRVGPGPGGLKSKTFPPDTGLSTMKQWREDQRVDARRTPATKAIRGSFADDIARYLSQVAAMSTLAGRRRDLYAWREQYGDLERKELTVGLIREQLHAWRTRGPVVRFDPRTKTRRVLAQPLSASACNHRRTALLHLYTVLDGKDAKNPVKLVPPFPEPAPEPRGRDLGFLVAAIARMENPKQRARAGVLLWTGMRGNSELGKMRPEFVDLEQRLCHVPSGKGGRQFRIVPLNANGLAAWKAFVAAKAWGTYDKNLLRRAFLRACRTEAIVRKMPVPRVRLYDLRHSLATAYLKAGADLADVQVLLGHTTTRMTRRYAPFQLAKLSAASLELEVSPPRRTPKRRRAGGRPGKNADEKLLQKFPGITNAPTTTGRTRRLLS